MMRKEALANGITIERDEAEDENDLVNAFNDATVSDDDFKKMLENSDRNTALFRQFSQKVRKIKIAAC